MTDSGTGGRRTAPRLGRAIAGGALLVGVLDFCAALAIGASTGASPRRVAQSIASGLLGRAAYEGGWPTAALGLALHFTIATGVATVFVLASRWWPGLRRRPWLWGPAYGILVFLVMYRVVLPLAGLDAWPRQWPGFVRAVAAHVFAVGLPVAWWTRRATSSAPAPR
ncbi:MAG: hypothetical protein AB7O28_13085 [Vicinamibacterales bacterium]